MAALDSLALDTIWTLGFRVWGFSPRVPVPAPARRRIINCQHEINAGMNVHQLS